MKISLFSLLLMLVSIVGALAQSSNAALFSEAQRAYLAGNTVVAKAKFEEILATEPSHSGAKNYLKLMAAADKSLEKSELAIKLSKIIVPKVTFKEASLGSVLAYLKTKASEISQEKTTPSFVLQLPPNFADQTSVTLDLANVPFTEVLRYLGELTSTKFEIQQYAIVVKPA